MRTWGTDRRGPWALSYPAPGVFGVMLSVHETGWLLSAGLGSHGVGVGWAYFKRRKTEFTVQFPSR